MEVSVLVVTFTPGFGALIQQTLEDTGRYEVALADNGSEALRFARTRSFDLCILDNDLLDISLFELGQELKKVLPRARMVVVPPGNDPANPTLPALAPDGYLTKPFYLPELTDILDRIMRKNVGAKASSSLSKLLTSNQDIPIEKSSGEQPGEPEPEQAAAAGPAPQWLEDVSLAAQHLTRLSLSSAAQAALIVRDDQLWAYAGELPQAAAQELAQAVARFSGPAKGSDLARFVRLEATGGEYMLYATSLGGNMLLSLVFDVSTPFSKIRSQAVHLARALSSPPDSETDTTAVEGSTGQAEASKADEAQADDNIFLDDGDEEDLLDLSSLPPLFDDVPPPSPTGWQPKSAPAKGPYIEEIDEEEQGEGEAPLSPAPDSEMLPNRWVPENISSETLPVELGDTQPSVLSLTGAEKTKEQPVTAVEIESQPRQPLSEAPAPSEASLAETQPALLTDDTAADLAAQIMTSVPPGSEGKKEDFQPGSASVVNLSYACMLIPRLPQHHLTGELAAHLTEWVPQLCLAFGWRLEHQAIRPDYLMWIVNVSPSTSPSYLMRIMRQHTSQRIFSEYPPLSQENPSGDFWAPGYLIMSSSQPPPAQVMRDFIKRTRNRQGASRPISRP